MIRLVRLFPALFLLATLAVADAHTAFERSEPKSGAVLTKPPNELRVWFTEPIKAGLSTIEVRSDSGQQVAGKDLQADPNEPKLIHLPFTSALAPGTYKVSWTAVAQDMHVSKGAFSFRVAPGH